MRFDMRLSGDGSVVAYAHAEKEAEKLLLARLRESSGTAELVYPPKRWGPDRVDNEADCVRIQFVRTDAATEGE